MNERIKELYKQAGFTVARGWGLKDTVPEDVFIANVCVSNEMKKFAELIVRECYLWAKENGGLGCEEDFEALKEHFGVE
jgi:hypothetical protein